MNTKNWAISLCSATISVALSISTALAETVEVIVNQLKVRSGPGLNYSVITAFDKGVRVNRIKQEGNWAYIAAGRVEGWVYTPTLRLLALALELAPEKVQAAAISGQDQLLRAINRVETSTTRGLVAMAAQTCKLLEPIELSSLR